MDTCVEELKRVVGSLSDPKYRDALLVALRLDTRHMARLVRLRRSSYNEALRRSTDPDIRSLHVDSLRTLERRENEGIRLVAQLLAEYASVSLIDEAPGPCTLATEGIAFVCRFSASGSLTSNKVTRWVRAPAPGADDQVSIAHQYYSESRTGILTLRDLVGCKVVEVKESTSGCLLATLAILRHLRPEDGLYSFSYEVAVKSENRCDPVFRWQARGETTTRAEFHFIFDAGMAPTVAWWFSSPNSMGGQMEPNPDEERHLDILDDRNYLCKIFEGGPLQNNIFYGVGWKWPT
ncbi:hypothetical protein ACGFNU_40950 [Spirillospora sp. NPDC048911]|uniref:hypothetical protein n=1 Tax=Spirillospora sp. NPDC048911 TaxID=3364527 RepID=UPI0037101CAF